MNQLHIVDITNIPILTQLQWEEALLRADKRNWCLINHGSPPAIVMGISGQVERLVDKDKWQDIPIPLIRRFSGGGTVVIDPHTIFVTFIFNTDSICIPPFPQPIMRWTETLYRPVFEDLPFCLNENDYVIGEKKIGGNAQSIIKGRWLHHTSFLYDYNSSLMDLLLIPEKAPEYRQQRTHADFLTKLKCHWQSIIDFKIELVSRLEKKFIIKTVNLEELNQIVLIPHRKATHLISMNEHKIPMPIHQD